MPSATSSQPVGAESSRALWWRASIDILPLSISVIPWGILCGALALVGVVQADVYVSIDANGGYVLSNVHRPGRTYERVIREPESSQVSLDQQPVPAISRADALLAAPEGNALPTDAQIIGAVTRATGKESVIMSAAGTMPGALHVLWRAAAGGYHMEYGFSCMGYEIAGAMGIKLARPDADVVCMVGDGSYMMANSELATAVMMAVPFTVVLTDNRGYGCINRLQKHTGGAPFNNLLDDSYHVNPSHIDFAAHAGSMGARAMKVATIAELDPFNPDNGPPYSDEFIAKYRAGQRARNQRITDWAKAELARLNAAGIPDRIFPLFRCWGDIRCVDPAIDPSDRKPNWCYRGDPAIANRTPSIGRANTIKTWLNMWSLETSPCQGQPHLAKHDTPALVVQGTADTGVYFVEDESWRLLRLRQDNFNRKHDSRKLTTAGAFT